MAFLFGKKRRDGDYITGQSMQTLMPYVMLNRNDSVVYFKQTIDVTEIENYIRQKRREGQRITVFNIIVTAIFNLFFERPRLNQFVSGRRIYRHKNFTISYVVKHSLTDDSDETTATLAFDENDNLFTISEMMADYITQIRNLTVEKSGDRIMSALQKFPRWLLRFIASSLYFLDFHDWIPAPIRDTLPFYSSVFLSHVGSLGTAAPIHHLYEFGTNSIFVTIGKIYDLPKKGPEGELLWTRAIDIWLAVDERICDGFYLAKSVRRLVHILEQPKKLEKSPAEWARERRLHKFERSKERQAYYQDREARKEENIIMYGEDGDYQEPKSESAKQEEQEEQ